MIVYRNKDEVLKDLIKIFKEISGEIEVSFQESFKNMKLDSLELAALDSEIYHEFNGVRIPLSFEDSLESISEKIFNALNKRSN